jgi:hypothetical protein
MKAYEKFENRLRELGLYEEWLKQGSCGRIATSTDSNVIVLVYEGDGDSYTEFTYPPIHIMSQDYNFRRRALDEYKDAGDEEFLRDLIYWYLYPSNKCPLFPVDVYLVWQNPTWVDFEDDDVAEVSTSGQLSEEEFMKQIINLISEYYANKSNH